MCSSCHAGWPDRATSCFLCKKVEKIALEAPSAIYELECITWILAPRDGQPTWIRMADPTTGSAADAQSKLAHSIDATDGTDSVPIQLRMSRALKPRQVSLCFQIFHPEAANLGPPEQGYAA